MIEHGSSSLNTSLYNYVIEHVAILGNHRFGNYVVQSLLEHGHRRQECAMAFLSVAEDIDLNKWGLYVLRTIRKYCDDGDVRIRCSMITMF